MNPRLLLNMNLHFNLTVDIKVDSFFFFFKCGSSQPLGALTARENGIVRPLFQSTYVFGARESERK